MGLTDEVQEVIVNMFKHTKFKKEFRIWIQTSEWLQNKAQACLQNTCLVYSLVT